MRVLRNYAALKLCIELMEITLFDKSMIKVGRRPMVTCSLRPEAKNKPLLGFTTEQILHTLRNKGSAK